MKKIIALPLMLCFALVLCTVGRAEPKADISPPGPKTEKVSVAVISSTDLFCVQNYATTDLGSADVKTPTETAVMLKPVAGSLPARDWEALRRRDNEKDYSSKATVQAAESPEYNQRE